MPFEILAFGRHFCLISNFNENISALNIMQFFFDLSLMLFGLR